VPNVVPGLLDLLAARYSWDITAEDLFAYLAAVLAHPAYPQTFAAELSTPGLRIPLTADPELFARTAMIGRRVIWLHTYGQRFTDPASGRPRRAPRLPADRAPKVLAHAAIPSDAAHMPDELVYIATAHELHVGRGRISNVTPRMRSYDVSGVNVLTKWFSYRRKTRDRPIIGDRRVSALSDIQLDYWHADYTRELIDLLNVLGLLADLEPVQSELLSAIGEGPLFSTTNLSEAGVLPAPLQARGVVKTWEVHATGTSPLW